MPSPSRQKRALPLWLRLPLLLLSVIFALLVALLAAFVTLLYKQPGEATPAVEEIAKYILVGRELSIGYLDKVRLGADTYVEARNVALANPDWSDTEAFVRADSVKLLIHLPSLFWEDPVLIREVHVSGVSLDLQDPQEHPPNWEIELVWDEETEADDGPLIPVIVEQASVQNATLRFRDPDQDELVKVHSLTLAVREDGDFTDLDITGEVNGQQLFSNGYIGPANALQTLENLELQLNLGMGNLQVLAQGRVENLLELAGADLDLEVTAPRSRPLLDLLGLEEVRDGPLHFEGYLKDAKPGVRLFARGELADFGLYLEGSVLDPAGADGIDLDFMLNGPSMAEAGDIAGFPGLKDVPFELSGTIQRSGTMLRLQDGVMLAAQGRLKLSGTLPLLPDIDDWQAALEGRDIDLSVLGPMLGTPDMPELLCDIDGELGSDDKGVELVGMKVSGGGLELVLNGVVGELPELTGTLVDARLSGDNMSGLEAILGLEPLPRQPFAIAGKLSAHEDGWRLEDAQLDTPNARLDLAGEVDDLVDPQRIQGSLALSTEDLPTALAEYGVKLDIGRNFPLRIEGNIRKVGDAFQIERLAGSLAKVDFSGEGLLNPAGDFGGSRLQLQTSGASLRQALQEWVDRPVPEEAFSLALDATYHAPLVSIDHLIAVVGSHQASAQLELDESEDRSPRVHGQAKLQGDNLRNLFSLAGIEVEIDRGSYQLVTDIEATEKKVNLKNLRFNATRSDIKGAADVLLAEVPRVDVKLRSDVMYLPDLLPDREELEQEQRQQEQAEGAYDSAELFTPPSKKEMQERVIPDTPLPLGWLGSLNGHWQYRIERAFLQENTYASLDMDLTLNDGILASRQLAWDGTVSRGKASLELDSTRNNQFIFELDSNRLPLLWLMVGEEKPQHSARYRARLAGSGATVREVAAGLNGLVLLEGSDVLLDNQGLDLVLGDVVASVLDRLNPFNETQQYTNMECAAGALAIKDGLIEAVPGLVMRTDKVDILGGGAVSLKDESLNINFNNRARRGLGISAGKAITPYLKVAGTLAHPYLTLDPEAVIVTGGLAIATGGLSMLAESLWDRWVATAQNPCEVLFEQARKDKERDYAPLLWQTPLERRTTTDG